MDFSETIKSIRIKENLTQEQFAQKLNVTRQAVSNWENNKNLPDIEMIITISDVFHVSLDLLLKGEDKNMNNLTEKVIHDGKETTRAKYNMVSTVIGTGFFLLGIILLFIKAVSVEHVDAQGFLHENFFLLPLGFLCLLISIAIFGAIGIRSIFRHMKK